MKTIIKIILFVFMATLLSGCPAIDWKEINFTRAKPAIENIVGTWIPTSDTLTYIRRKGGYPVVKHELIIRANGSFSMRNMPDWWSDGFGESKKGFESGDGVWRFRQDSNIWTIWLIELEFSYGISSVHLYKQGPPYLIFIRVGDPNNGEAMFFERSIKEKP